MQGQIIQIQANPMIQRIWEQSEQIRISLGASTIDDALAILRAKEQLNSTPEVA